MQKILGWFAKSKVLPRHVSVILLFISLIAYGLISPYLGFYQDDWHFIYYYITRGSQGLLELFNYDGHPFSVWTYILGFKILGLNPLAWQLFSVLWRWITSVVVWKLFHQLWPNHLRQTVIAALFFLLYPAFILQPQAITYFEVWISHTVLVLSFYYVGRGIQENKQRYHLLGLLFKIIHIFTSLYVTGLEFIRPVIIWLQLSKTNERTTRQKLVTTIKLWFPYFLINVAYLTWRLFIYNSPVENRADPNTVFALLDKPIQTIQTLVLNLFPDLILILASSWYPILSPSTIDFSRLFGWLIFVIMLFMGFAIWLIAQKTDSDESQNTENLPWSALFLGGLFVLLGLTPYYAIGYFMNEKLAPWNGRVALGSIAGAGLLISMLFHGVITARHKQNIILAILVTLMIGWQIRSANEFRYAWEKQQVLYQQLSWRIPSLQENTAILAEQEILFLMGDYPTSFAINTIYAQPTAINDRQIPYWFFTTSGNFWGKEKDLVAGKTISDQQHSLYFSGDSRESIVIRFEPQAGECLWVLRPLDSESKLLRPMEQMLASISDLERIQQEEKSLLSKILPDQSEKSWCYFYQKADLARQFNQWSEVLILWDQAQNAGKRPRNGFEYAPFIEAYAHTGDWGNAQKLTNTANQVSQAMNSQLCPIWRNLYRTTSSSQQKDVIFEDVTLSLGCDLSFPNIPNQGTP